MATSIQENTSSTSLVAEHHRTRVDFAETKTPRVGETRSTRSLSTCVDTVPAGKRAFYQSRRRYRRIDWRWQRAREIRAAESSLNPLYDDSHTERLLEYLELADTNPQAAKRHDPDLARAREIYEAGGEQDGLLRAWLLTELSLPEIAERVDLSESVVEAYVAMFYDVRDRRTKRDWVVLHVIKLHTRTFPDFKEREFATWQFEAMDGARALDNFLDLARFKPIRGGDVTRNIDEAILRILRYCIYVVMVTMPFWEIGNPRVWQRLYFEQRKLELAQQRQNQMKHSGLRKTRQSANCCSTRSRDGIGDTVERIEKILLSFYSKRPESEESLLRSGGDSDSDVSRDDGPAEKSLRPGPEERQS